MTYKIGEAGYGWLWLFDTEFSDFVAPGGPGCPLEMNQEGIWYRPTGFADDPPTFVLEGGFPFDDDPDVTPPIGWRTMPGPTGLVFPGGIDVIPGQSGIPIL